MNDVLHRNVTSRYLQNDIIVTTDKQYLLANSEPTDTFNLLVKVNGDNVSIIDRLHRLKQSILIDIFVVITLPKYMLSELLSSPARSDSAALTHIKTAVTEYLHRKPHQKWEGKFKLTEFSSLNAAKDSIHWQE